MKNVTYFVELKDMRNSCIYPIILNDEQIRLLKYLEDNKCINRDVYINYKAEDYKKI